MSYPRPRSRGCYACRTRKVKCGQETPHCLRCLKSGNICPGYRAEDELVFRDMNKTAENRVQLRVEGSKAKRGQLVEPSQGASSASASRFESDGIDFSASPDIATSSSSSNEDQTFDSLIESVPLPMSPDWSSQAPCLFFADYVFVSKMPGTPSGYLEFLPNLCAGSQSVCLMQALDAVSFANLTNQSNLAWLNRRARRSYGKALVSINAALRDAQEVTRDSTLAAVFLMGMFELISADTPSIQFWDSHVGGGELLIRLRGSQQIQSDREKSLFRIVFTQVQLAHIIKRSVIPAEDLNLLNGLDKNLPNVALTMSISKLAKIRSTSPKTYQTLDLRHEPTQQQLKTWFEEAISLDAELQAWADTVLKKFPTFRYTELINDPAAQPAIIHGYKNLFIAGTWCIYRCIRFMLLLDLIDCEARFRRAAVPPFFATADADAEPHCYQPQSDGWQATITDMADGICASIPFMLGDLDPEGNLQGGAGRMALGGMFLIWPLQVMRNTGVMRREQQGWVQDVLKRMGHTMGIHRAHLLVKRP